MKLPEQDYTTSLDLAVGTLKGDFEPLTPEDIEGLNSPPTEGMTLLSGSVREFRGFDPINNHFYSAIELMGIAKFAGKSEPEDGHILYLSFGDEDGVVIVFDLDSGKIIDSEDYLDNDPNIYEKIRGALNSISNTNMGLE